MRQSQFEGEIGQLFKFVLRSSTYFGSASSGQRFILVPCYISIWGLGFSVNAVASVDDGNYPTDPGAKVSRIQSIHLWRSARFQNSAAEDLHSVLSGRDDTLEAGETDDPD